MKVSSEDKNNILNKTNKLNWRRKSYIPFTVYWWDNIIIVGRIDINIKTTNEISNSATLNLEYFSN